MWNFFKTKESELSPEPNVRDLNNSILHCHHCNRTLKLANFAPLSIEKCPKCETPFFVPHKIKNFWLYKPLGGGGMGSVYEAFEGKLSSKHAVKVLPRDKLGDPYLINALMNEAEAAQVFGEHPHLAKVDDFGEANGEHFLSMSFIKGQRLDQLIGAEEFTSPRFVLLWALHLLSAEQKIYDCGYLYRDLKPQNIIIDEHGNAVLIDFGLCVKIEEAEKKRGPEGAKVQGSPLYMPPERIVGAGEQMASEIYSLGMVMFHTLSKKTYYTASGAYDLAQKHVSSLRFLSAGHKLPPSVDPKIVALVDSMIARLPVDRFPSYKAAANAISKIYEEMS